MRSLYPSSGLTFFSERICGVNDKEPAFKSAVNWLISRFEKLPVIDPLLEIVDCKEGALMTVSLRTTAMRQPLLRVMSPFSVPSMLSFAYCDVHVFKERRASLLLTSKFKKLPFDGS